MSNDVIVIGGGHNGLICAAYLARTGFRTTVVEARSTVGGCASTESDLGARFNICNCDHMVFRGTPIAEELDLAAHGLRYLDLDPVQQQVHWDGSASWVLFHEVDRTLDALARTHPDEVDGYRRYLAAALPVVRLVTDIANGVPTPRRVGGIVARRRGSGIPTLLQWRRLSAAEVLRKFFRSEALLGPVLTTGPGVWGLSPYTPGTGLGALGYALKHVIRAGRPVGGSGSLPDAVLSSFVAAGGQVSSGSRVESIVCDGGQVRGVRLSDGTLLEAPRVVIASDPRKAFVEYLANPPAQARQLVRRWTDSPVHEGYESKIDAVISTLPEYRAVDRSVLRDFGVDDPLIPTTVISPTVDQIAEAHARAASGAVAAAPMMLANIPSALDPSMKPSDSEHIFSLEVLFTPYSLTGGWPASPEPQRWLESYATLLTNGDAFLSGINRHRAMTPDRYESEFFMPKGYATSFAGSPVSALLGKPQELTRYTTPIHGLFLTGAATFPGAGVWGASGRNTATVVIGSA